MRCLPALTCRRWASSQSVSARDNILGRIRTSLRRADGDGAAALVRAHIAARALSPRPPTSGDLVARFRDNAVRLSNTIAEVADVREAPAAIAAYLRAYDLPLRAVCWPALGDLDWAGNGVAVEVRPAREPDLVGITEVFCAIAEVSHVREVPAAAAAYLRAYDLPLRAVCWPALGDLDWAGSGVAVEVRPARESDLVGITEVFCAIAETGTLMTLSGAQTPPVSSLLPETHIGVLRTSQIVPAMEEAWQRLRSLHGPESFMPRAVNFISGPSRTADIEQTLTFGAHGPYRVHVILVHSS